MTRLLMTLGILAALSACGGGPRNVSSGYVQPRLFATGPIFAACLQTDRRAATRARCGCVQAVANQSLNLAEQRRGAVFFKNPALAQEIRQSDNAANERFWLRWKEYGARAEQYCRGT